MQLLRDLDKNSRLLRVYGAHPSMIFIANLTTQILSIYRVPGNSSIYTQDTLAFCRIQTVKAFEFKRYISYYYTDESLYYLEKQNLMSVNLETGRKTIFETKNWLEEIFMSDERGIYARGKNDMLYFMDISWSQRLGDNGKPLPVVNFFNDQFCATMALPIYKQQTVSLLRKFEFDPLSMLTAAFISPTKLVLTGSLSQPVVHFDGSANFSNHYSAFNVYADDNSPAEYNNTVCAFNADQGLIRSWNQGTGKVVHIERLSGSSSAGGESEAGKFKAFKYHNTWDNHCLIVKEEVAAGGAGFGGEQERVILCAKVKVQRAEVEVACSVTHRTSNVGSQLYVSHDNNLLLEFQGRGIVRCFQII